MHVKTCRAARELTLAVSAWAGGANVVGTKTHVFHVFLFQKVAAAVDCTLHRKSMIMQNLPSLSETHNTCYSQCSFFASRHRGCHMFKLHP